MRKLGLSLLAIALVIGCSKAAMSDRASEAVKRAKPKVEALAKKAGLKSLPNYIYLRAFKEEKTLELWGAVNANEKMTLVASYPIARLSGKLGPKRMEGDGQVPEGLYLIDRFNPNSQFHLSLGLNYPNASDKVRSDKERPGGDIFIHGSNVSIGCLAMTDPIIEEIWTITAYARDKGQAKIPVHIFPSRMTDENMSRLFSEHNDKKLQSLWKEIKPFFDAFEQDKIVPKFEVGYDGTYLMSTRR